MPNDNTPIAIGDMVMIVRGRPCCNVASELGKTFVVEAIRNYPARCTVCGHRRVDTFYLYFRGEEVYAYHRYELKRIPPLEESTCQETAKETHSLLET